MKTTLWLRGTGAPVRKGSEGVINFFVSRLGCLIYRTNAGPFVLFECQIDFSVKHIDSNRETEKIFKC